MRFLVHADFAAKGISYSRQHVKRLVSQKKFPSPIKGVCKENAWTESAIDQYLKERIAAAREHETASA